MKFSRRSLLHLAGLAAAAGGGARAASGLSPQTYSRHEAEHGGHAMGTVGRVASNIFNPSAFLRAWNFSDLPDERRKSVYRESPRPDGSLLREYQLVAIDREIEIAPRVFFPAWTYNGQVPGPTIRAQEGDRVRVTFLNQGSHPHTIHFHGWHPPAMDGSLPSHEVKPGDTSSTSSTLSRPECTCITATRRR